MIGSTAQSATPSTLRSRTRTAALTGSTTLAVALLAGCGSAATPTGQATEPTSSAASATQVPAPDLASLDPVARFSSRCTVVRRVASTVAATAPGTHLCVGSTARVPVDDAFWGTGAVDVTVTGIDRPRPSALDDADRAGPDGLTGLAVLRVRAVVVRHRPSAQPGPGFDLFHGGGMDVATDGVHSALPSDSVTGCAAAYLPQDAGPGTTVTGCTVAGLLHGATALGGAFADRGDYLTPADQIIWS